MVGTFARAHSRFTVPELLIAAVPCLSAFVAEGSIIMKSGMFFIITLLDLTRQNLREDNLSFNKKIVYKKIGQ